MIRIIGIPPGPTAIQNALKKYGKSEGVITSFSDAKLRAARKMATEEAGFEFLVFNDLLHRFIQFMGIQSGRITTQGQLRAAVAITSKELTHSSPFFRSSQYGGFHKCVVQTLIELHEYCFNLKDFELISQNSNSFLSKKVSSLKFLESEIRDIYEKQGLEFTSDLVEKCLNSNFKGTLPLKHILIFAGPENHPLFVQWLKWIAHLGIHVDLIVEYLPTHPELFKYSQKISTTLNQEIITSDSIEPWYTTLFTSQLISSNTKVPEIWKISAPDSLSECEWILRGCLDAIREGIWPHKIGIYYRDSQKYTPLILASAKRLGVPISITLNAPLLTNGFALFTLHTLEALASNDIRSLKDLIKSSYLELSYEAREDINQAIHNAYTDTKDPWLNLMKWSQKKAGVYPWLFHFLNWRKEIISDSYQLCSWLERLRNLLGSTAIPDTIAEKDIATRERDLRAQTALQRSIADYAISFDSKNVAHLNFKEFVGLCKHIWDQEDTAFPASHSGIIVSNLPETFTDLDVLFSMGMLEGIIPSRRSEDPILNDKNRYEIAKIFPVKPLLRDSFSIAQDERDLFIRLCALPDQKLVFSYPQADENRDNVPAFYLYELERGLQDRLFKKDFSRALIVPQERECNSPADYMLRKALDSPKLEYKLLKLVTSKARNIVIADLNEPLHPEEITQNLMCPFQAVFQYRLNLKNNRTKNLWNRLKQIPLDAHLILQDHPDTAKKSLDDAIHGELDQQYSKLADWETHLLLSGTHRLEQGWIDREFKSRQLWNDRKPQIQTKVDMSHEQVRNEIPLKGKKILLKGSIPAISTRGDYSVLHFYDSKIPDFWSNIKPNPDLMIYGLYLMTQFGRKPGLALEIDSMTGEKLFALLPRFMDATFPSNKKDDLQVKELASDPSLFFRNIKAMLAEAIEIMEKGSIETKPGPYCRQCQFGELCRNSEEFGEKRNAF